MSARNPSRTFVPEQPPKVIWDLSLNRPVLLIGHWLDDQRRPFIAEVVSMATARPPYQLRDLPKLEPISTEEP